MKKTLVGAGVALVGLFVVLRVVTGPRKPMQVDGWAYVRQRVVTIPDDCFERRPDTCLNDPALVDELIRKALKGKPMPTDDIAAEDVVREARWAWDDYLRSPDGLAKLAARLEDRYQHPVVTDHGAEIVVDYGLVPSELTSYKSSTRLSNRGPHLEGDFGEWRIAEIAQAFATYGATHAFVRLEADVPHAFSLQHETWIWDRDGHRVTFVSSSYGTENRRVTENVDLGALARGELNPRR